MLTWNIFRSITNWDIFYRNPDIHLLVNQKTIDPKSSLMIKEALNVTVIENPITKTITIPIPQKWKKYISVDEQYAKEISELSQKRIISDKIYKLIIEFILDWYEAVQEEWEPDSAVVFKIRDIKKLRVWDLNQNLQLLMIKEFFDYNTRSKPLYDERWAPYQIWQDIETQWWVVKWLVWPTTRYALFSDKKFYKKTGKLKQDRQYYADLVGWWITAIIAWRRMWKTYVAIDSCIKFMLSELSFRDDKPVNCAFIAVSNEKLKTPIKYAKDLLKNFIDVWLASVTNNEARIWTYEQDPLNPEWLRRKVLWIIEFVSWQSDAAWVWDSYDYIVIDECERQPKSLREDIFPIVSNEWAKCLLISTLNKRAERTWFYDIIVEWEINQDIPVEQLLNARRLYCEAPENKKEQVREEQHFELKESRMRVWKRFTWADWELLSPRQKEIVEGALKKYPVQYLAEWRWIFPEEKNWIEYEMSIKQLHFEERTYPEYIITAYDPAEMKDRAAVVTIVVSNNKIAVVDEMLIPPWSTSAVWPTMIRNFIAQNTAFYKWKKHMFGYDANWQWLTIEDYLTQVWVYPNFRVRARWPQSGVTKTEHPVYKNRTLYNIPKDYMVELLKEMLELGILTISADCVHLINELKTFQASAEEDDWLVIQKRYKKYEAKRWFTDDFVSALMYALRYALDPNWLWLKNSLLESYYNDTINQIQKDSPESVQKESFRELFHRRRAKQNPSSRSTSDVLNYYTW